MTARVGRCLRCSAPVRPAHRFCGSCGGALFDAAPVAVPRTGRGPQGPCDCGNADFTDGYCTVCGQRRAEPDRDEVDVGGLVLLTDRGLLHARNEDAAAAGVVPSDDGRFAFAVAVCDGVSTSVDAQTAATAAAQAGVAAMLDALAACHSGHSAAATGLAGAARAAARTAGVGIDPDSAPACTYTAAAVIPAAPDTVHITVANVGDSRVYWLPEPPGSAVQLTVDDSVAQELIGAGASAESAAVRAGAHTLTRWLGADAEADAAPRTDSSVRTIAATGAGLLVVCTDGLWNYLPEPDAIARVCGSGNARTVARRLVDHALQAGGHDNVTVAVIPIGGHNEFA